MEDGELVGSRNGMKLVTNLESTCTVRVEPQGVNAFHTLFRRLFSGETTGDDMQRSHRGFLVKKMSSVT